MIQRLLYIQRSPHLQQRARLVQVQEVHEGEHCGVEHVRVAADIIRSPLDAHLKNQHPEVHEGEQAGDDDGDEDDARELAHEGDVLPASEHTTAHKGTTHR